MPGVRYVVVLAGTAPAPPPPELSIAPAPPPPPPPLRRISYVPSWICGAGYEARRGKLGSDAMPSFGSTVKKHWRFVAPAGASFAVNMLVELSKIVAHCRTLSCAKTDTDEVASARSAKRI